MTLNITHAQPRVKIANHKKDFGNIQRGEVLRHAYPITNEGDVPLVFTEAEAGCSCTTVQLPKAPVLPGKTDTVIVTFNTASVYGRQDRVVFLSSNDPKTPAKVRFKANVSKK